MTPDNRQVMPSPLSPLSRNNSILYESDKEVGEISPKPFELIITDKTIDFEQYSDSHREEIQRKFQDALRGFELANGENPLENSFDGLEV